MGGGLGANVSIEPPFHCVYGSNITLGRDVLVNFDCLILDSAAVTIGDKVLLGPGVHIYAGAHTVDSELRAKSWLEVFVLDQRLNLVAANRSRCTSATRRGSAAGRSFCPV